MEKIGTITCILCGGLLHLYDETNETLDAMTNFLRRHQAGDHRPWARVKTITRDEAKQRYGRGDN